jgi:peptidoglycan-associated lipoprotein
MKLIKQAACIILPAVLLLGCETTPEEPEAAPPTAVERAGEGEPAMTTPAAPGEGMAPEALPSGVIGAPGKFEGHPLDDPESLLSKRTIYFEYDKYNIKDEYRDVLMAHAEYLASNPSARVTIEGHCDERGTREYNIGLGERRASAVRQMLLLQGVAASQVNTISYGEERPVALGHDESAWSLNRRSEIVYTIR